MGKGGGSSIICTEPFCLVSVRSPGFSPCSKSSPHISGSPINPSLDDRLIAVWTPQLTLSSLHQVLHIPHDINLAVNQSSYFLIPFLRLQFIVAEPVSLVFPAKALEEKAQKPTATQRAGNGCIAACLVSNMIVSVPTQSALKEPVPPLLQPSSNVKELFQNMPRTLSTRY